MKGKEFLDDMSYVDNDLILEAEKSMSTKKKLPVWTRWAAAAACLVLVVASVLAIPKLTGKRPGNAQILEKHVPGTQTEIAPEVPFNWDDELDCRRYHSLEFGGKTYETRLLALHAENEGAVLGTATAKGKYVVHGEDTGEIKSTEVTVTEVRGVDPRIAVGVRFSEDDKYSYVYADEWYSPETLGDFIDGTNLRDYLKTKVCFHYTGPNDVEDAIAYEDVATETVWEMLLSDRSLKNVPEQEPGRKVMSIQASMDVLGYHHTTITLTEDGWLWTNILSTKKCFFIGTEAAEAFVKEVTENHQGYKYIYDDTLTGFDE